MEKTKSGEYLVKDFTTNKVIKVLKFGFRFHFDKFSNRYIFERNLVTITNEDFIEGIKQCLTFIKLRHERYFKQTKLFEDEKQ